MGPRWVTTLCLACAVSAILVGQVWAYSGGSGTLQDPFQIADANDLGQLGSTPADQDKHFVLVADIDLAGKTWSTAVVPTFSGVFNGSGHTIRNLMVDGRGNSGLFGTLLPYGQIKSLHVVDVNVVSYAGDVGGLVGFNDMGRISGSSSSGKVKGGGKAGGLVGFNDGGGIIVNCSSSVDVQGDSDIGGLVGTSAGGVIHGCSSSGQVTGRTTTDASRRAGRSYRCVGGLVGATAPGGHIVNCWSSGKVTGDEDVGGLIGDNSGSVANCYSIGMVTGRSNVGGLVGSGGDDVSRCFWDTETSGQTVSKGGTGLSTTQMKSVETIWMPAGTWSAGRRTGHQRSGKSLMATILSWRPRRDTSLSTCRAGERLPTPISSSRQPTWELSSTMPAPAIDWRAILIWSTSNGQRPRFRSFGALSMAIIIASAI